MSVDILRKAHGAASGAVLVAETPPLDEVGPLHVADTEAGLAVRKAKGRPFQKGNRAAADRGPSLAGMGVDLNTEDEERRRVHRKAKTLERHRVREMSVLHGGTLSSGVCTELVSWALAVAWSRYFYDHGDSTRGAQLAEKASAHQLKAIGIAEREAAARPRRSGLEALRTRVMGSGST